MGAMKPTGAAIDRAARDQAAAVLEAFLAGTLPASDLPKRYPTGSLDPALHAIGSCLWFHHDDVGPARDPVPIPPDARRTLQRCLAFLRSDEEYRWPVRSLISIRSIVLHPLISGLLILLALVALNRNGNGPWFPWDAAAALPLWIGILVLRNRLEARATRILRAAGDPAAWPFLRLPGGPGP